MCVCTGINVFVYKDPKCHIYRWKVGCVYIGISAYEAEPKPGNATEMTPSHLNGPCHQACILNAYSNRAYSKALGIMLKKPCFVF